ncbi:MAG: hypothetical protein H6Q67_1242 [Firmicutes bacterium]|nr:hypothetical protein [Bacillota bacterium]
MSSIIKIGIIGDYDAERPSHKATNEAIRHSAGYLGLSVEVRWLPTESLENDIEERLACFDGFWCAPGSPYKSMQGAIRAIRFARERDYPFIGTCGGFQHAVLEYAQNQLGMTEAQHEEVNPEASQLVISLLSCSLVGETCTIFINKSSKTFQFYQKGEAKERYTCSFGLNPKFQQMIDESGFKVVGTDETGQARILELSQNKFFIATLFQPQLSSEPENPHSLIVAFLTYAREFHCA